MFIVSKIGHVEEDSHAVTHVASGRRVLVTDTGNGGDTAYQLLLPYFNECIEIKPFPAYTYATAAAAIEAAKRYAAHAA